MMRAEPLPSLDARLTVGEASPRVPLLREPFLHFVLIGALLFGLDQLLRPAEPENLIVVGSEVDSEALHVFEDTHGREPTEAERRALHQVFLDNEVLYREGLAMGVDRGDPAIRDRVIFKALSVVDANIQMPAISDEELQAWFESRRARYDEPARYDFDEAALSGPADEATVRAFVTRLNGGEPGDTGAGLRVFKGRPYANLEQSYGAAFAQAVAALPPGDGLWHAVEGRGGWRAIRLNGMTAAQPADFAMMRNVVYQDWKDHTAAQLRTDEVRRLAQKYEIRYENRPS